MHVMEKMFLSFVCYSLCFRLIRGTIRTICVLLFLSGTENSNFYDALDTSHLIIIFFVLFAVLTCLRCRKCCPAIMCFAGLIFVPLSVGRKLIMGNLP